MSRDEVVREIAKEFLRRHEGLRLEPYTDTTGHRSIGYGRNLDSMPYNDLEIALLNEMGLRENKINTAFAEYMLTEAVFWATTDCYSVFGDEFRFFSVNRQAALIDWMYNLGIHRARGFVRMIAAVKVGDWKRAAIELLNSRYAQQVKGRANRLAGFLEKG